MVHTEIAKMTKYLLHMAQSAALNGRSIAPTACVGVKDRVVALSAVNDQDMDAFLGDLRTACTAIHGEWTVFVIQQSMADGTLEEVAEAKAWVDTHGSLEGYPKSKRAIFIEATARTRPGEVKVTILPIESESPVKFGKLMELDFMPITDDTHVNFFPSAHAKDRPVDELN